jgi:hypothetical protein
MLTEADTELWALLCDHLDRARRPHETRAETLSRLIDPQHFCVTCEMELHDPEAVRRHRAQGHFIWPAVTDET